MAQILNKLLTPNIKLGTNSSFLLIVRHQSSSPLVKDFYNEEQLQLQDSVKKLVEKEINPHTEKWEKDKIFPAHEVFKKFGEAGFLGINKPVEYGGLGLSYKHQLAFLEASGYIRSSGVAMGIGVQTDCSTPALARFGSSELKKDFLEPALKGKKVNFLFLFFGSLEISNLFNESRRPCHLYRGK